MCSLERAAIGCRAGEPAICAGREAGREKAAQAAELPAGPGRTALVPAPRPAGLPRPADPRCPRDAGQRGTHGHGLAGPPPESCRNPRRCRAGQGAARACAQARYCRAARACAQLPETAEPPARATGSGSAGRAPPPWPGSRPERHSTGRPALPAHLARAGGRGGRISARRGAAGRLPPRRWQIRSPIAPASPGCLFHEWPDSGPGLARPQHLALCPDRVIRTASGLPGPRPARCLPAARLPSPARCAAGAGSAGRVSAPCHDPPRAWAVRGAGTGCPGARVASRCRQRPPAGMR
jgi:hypothetical protein